MLIKIRIRIYDAFGEKRGNPQRHFLISLFFTKVKQMTREGSLIIHRILLGKQNKQI